MPFIHFGGGILCSFSPVKTITFYLLKDRAVLKVLGAELGLGSGCLGSPEHRAKTDPHQEFLVCEAVGGGAKGEAGAPPGGPIRLLCLCAFISFNMLLITASNFIFGRQPSLIFPFPARKATGARREGSEEGAGGGWPGWRNSRTSQG